MTQGETDVALKMPTTLIDKLDTIAKQKYLNRSDVIIDACAYYCQHYDMHNELLPATTRSIFFNLARHDNEFRKTLRDALRDGLAPDSENHNNK
jgi:metal-responsive CopG/Arc/MetJ family transcriptional regulator